MEGILSYHRIKPRTLPHCHIATLAIGLAVLSLAGCSPEPEDDYSISKITISNIPEKIPVSVGYPEPPPLVTTYNDTYKIYLNASDYMEADKPHKAQATALIADGDFDAASGTYTITLELRKPILGAYGADPDENDGPWSGTANYFSVVLSPRDVSADGQRAIYIKASDKALNRGMANIDWTKDLTVDFNKAIAEGVTIMNLAEKAERIYEDIVLKDDAITR